VKKPSVLPPGVRFRGEIEGEGDLLVFGQVDGPVRVEGGLVIEDGGLVRGHVHARKITVRGALKGDAFADESIRVDASGRLVGDLTAPRVRVTPGAQFSGQVHVQALDAAPPLRTYDPALHTFTGLPAPKPISAELAAGLTLPESGERDPDDTRPFTSLRQRPSRLREAGEAMGEPPEDDQRPTDHRAIAPEPREPEPPRPPVTTQKPPAQVGRMPRIGRVKGSHRPRR
jgi:cytoskeletal protein CcmA (bactofilin family)